LQLINCGTLVASSAGCFSLFFFFTQIHRWKKWEEEIQKNAAGNGITTQLVVVVAHRSILVQ
jgi:hypothetical protein